VKIKEVDRRKNYTRKVFVVEGQLGRFWYPHFVSLYMTEALVRFVELANQVTSKDVVFTKARMVKYKPWRAA
jgi:hypothetical protein